MASNSIELNATAFDMENVLTRAVHRVLSGGDHYSFSSNNVEKPKAVHFHTNVSQGQIRLVADQLCRRIEKRYERRLAEELNRERVQTERKLNQIKNEYRLELEQKKRELQQEKSLMEERVREKERTLQHMMDLKELDKSGNLVLQQKLLENRYSELKLAIERLEKTEMGFKKRMKADLETVRLEWEKLSLKESQLAAVQIHVDEGKQLRKAKEQLDEVKDENKKYRTTIDQLERDNLALKEKLERAEDELRLFLFRVRDSRPDSVLLNELLAENNKLKDELLRAQMKSNSDSVLNASRLKMEFDQKDEAQNLKIREQKQIINMMNDKIRHLTTDRNYLKERVKDLQREQWYAEKKEKKKDKTREKQVKLSEESGSSSSDDSSHSKGSMEIANIKKRISNLDQIARQLDASVEMFSFVNKSSSSHYVPYEEEDSHGYDDFCRGMIPNAVKHSSPIKQQPILEEPSSRFVPKKSDYGDEISAVISRKSPETPQKIATESPKAKQPSVQTATAPVVTSQPESDFAARLRMRNTEITRRPSIPTEDEPKKEEESKTTQENPMFQPKTSALDDYMSMISRQNEEAKKPSAPKPQVEPVFDEVQFEQLDDADDDIDW